MENKEVIKIAGGMDWDDDMQSFGDYWETVLHARKYLNVPITIRSPEIVWRFAQIETHMASIVIEYEDEDVVEMWDFRQEKKVKVVVVNELEYIVSRPWIKDWIVDDDMLDETEVNYKIQFTDGETVVETGILTLT